MSITASVRNLANRAFRRRSTSRRASVRARCRRRSPREGRGPAGSRRRAPPPAERAGRGLAVVRVGAGVVGRSSGRRSASATGLVLAASFQDCVLIDLVGAGGPEHRGRLPRHAVPLRRDALVRRAGPRPVQPEPHGHAPEGRARRPLAQRPRPVLPGPQGRAARARAAGSRRLDDRAAPGRGRQPRVDAPIVGLRLRRAAW